MNTNGPKPWRRDGAHLPEGSEGAGQRRGQGVAVLAGLWLLRLRLLGGLSVRGRVLPGDPQRGLRVFLGVEQRVVGQLGVAGHGRGLLTVQAAGEGVSLAAGAQRPGAGARDGVGAGGQSPLPGVGVHGRGDEVGAGAGHAALQVVRLGAAQGGGRAEVAQVVGTVDHGLLAALQGQDGPLGRGRQVVVVVVELLLLQGLAVLRGRGHRLQHPRELAVAALAVGAAVPRLAPVASLAGRRGHFGAGRQRRGRGEGVHAGDAVRAQQVRPGGGTASISNI